MTPINTADSRIAKIALMEGGIIYIRHKHIKEFPSFEEIKELVHTTLKLANNNKFILVTDFRDMFQNWSSESKEYVANHTELNKLKIAQAILVNTLPVKLLINTFMAFNKPKGEIKVFDNFEKVETWIKEVQNRK